MNIEQACEVWRNYDSFTLNAMGHHMNINTTVAKNIANPLKKRIIFASPPLVESIGEETIHTTSHRTISSPGSVMWSGCSKATEPARAEHGDWRWDKEGEWVDCSLECKWCQIASCMLQGPLALQISLGQSISCNQVESSYIFQLASPQMGNNLKDMTLQRGKVKAPHRAEHKFLTWVKEHWSLGVYKSSKR